MPNHLASKCYRLCSTCYCVWIRFWLLAQLSSRGVESWLRHNYCTPAPTESPCCAYSPGFPPLPSPPLQYNHLLVKRLLLVQLSSLVGVESWSHNHQYQLNGRGKPTFWLSYSCFRESCKIVHAEKIEWPMWSKIFFFSFARFPKTSVNSHRNIRRRVICI